LDVIAGICDFDNSPESIDCWQALPPSIQK
jgi:hypothetical protein